MTVAEHPAIGGFEYYRQFWLFQGIGWFAYSFLKIFAFPTTIPDVFYIAFKYILISSVLHLLYQYLFQRDCRFAWIVTIAVPACLVASVLSLALSLYLNLRGWVLSPYAWTWLGSREGLLHSWLLFMAWSAFYFGGRYALQLKAERNALVVALARADEARARMLRYQLNPHFLFNAMNSVRALINQDTLRAREMVTALAGYMRYALRVGEHEEILLEEELEAVEQYLSIEKIRFEERLRYTINIDLMNPSRRIPSLLMQPLVENAVKHGMRTAKGDLEISIRVDETPERLRILVCNTGAWQAAGHADASQPSDSGVGLNNIASRLAQHFPNNHEFHWHETDGQVSVEILIGRSSPVVVTTDHHQRTAVKTARTV